MRAEAEGLSPVLFCSSFSLLFFPFIDPRVSFQDIGQLPAV